jgi:hypothetical protein
MRNGVSGMTALVGHPGSFCWAPRYALGGAHERRKLLLKAPVAGPPAAMKEMASEGPSLRRIAKIRERILVTARYVGAIASGGNAL